MGSLSSWTVNPLQQKPGEKWNFGASVTGLDLRSLTSDDVNRLRDAVWRHKVVIVKDNGHIEPKHQEYLMKSLDPETAYEAKGQNDINDRRNGLLTKARSFPGVPGVRLFGKGFQGEDHYGFKNLTLDRWARHDWHVSPPSEEDFENGTTRFQRWHFDASLYGDEPTWFTCLRTAKQPEGPDLKIEWADGSGFSMNTPPALTAFFSSVQLYDMLTPEEKQLVDHSWVEYAPHPFKWIERCKSRNTGLGIAGGGQLTEEELPEYDPAKVKKYPMVWVNPLTGEKAFQVHGICVRKLFLRRSVEEKPRVIDNVGEIHDFVLGIQHRALKPEYILLAPTEEGDMIIWDNYGLFHTAIDYPAKYGERSMHKADTGGSIGPRGPVPVPAY